MNMHSSPKPCDVYESSKEEQIRAVAKIDRLRDALIHYGYSGYYLELYLARLVFCLFAQATGIFPRNAFLRYLKKSKMDGSDIAKLFEVLTLPPKQRDQKKDLSPFLLKFQYLGNCPLFLEKSPQLKFDERIHNLLIKYSKFKWNRISPTIIGSVFQSYLSKEERKELGTHYISEENILKVINPLFMDNLWEQYESVKDNCVELAKFHDSLAHLKFLDPACGCGDFLLVTYRELRRLELEIIKVLLSAGKKRKNLDKFLKVNVSQFYGIELEKIPSMIAQISMWILDGQLNKEVQWVFKCYNLRPRLKHNATIVNANALTQHWLDIVPGKELNYIIGNPPFKSKNEKTAQNKKEMAQVFSGCSNFKTLDYVACWHRKACKIMFKYPHIKTAFVSTNSICQGEQVAPFWESLKKFGPRILFCYKPFRWSNEAKNNAGVYCIILGLSCNDTVKSDKTIFYQDEKETRSLPAKNINGYLVDGANILIKNRATPIQEKILPIIYGSASRDNGNLILSKDAYDKLLQENPLNKQFVRKYWGGNEFLNNEKRYCLWLVDTKPEDYEKSKFIMYRITANKQYREKNSNAFMQKLAETPALFGEIRQPDSHKYLLIPKVSSGARDYIPIGFCKNNIVASGSALVVPKATRYHFGILTSCVHMAWMKIIAARFGNAYQYSTLVYNTFVWPKASKKRNEKIKELAQEILNIRKQFKKSTLADLYNPCKMPPELLKAHKKLDEAVLKLYKLPASATEDDITAKLISLYKEEIEKGQSMS